MTDHLDKLKAALADRYRFDREVGAGGMATVYLAEDLKHHRKVAIKVLRAELAATLGPDRFLREIEIAAGLTHPHILPLHDSGEADGVLYYVMPYIEGQSLRDKLAREGELPVSEATRLLHDIAEALGSAHKHNVVHRDVKPDNVMLTEQHALVTDFGVAKAVSEATGARDLTTAGVSLGTPAYMAPEQAAADPHVDHRADIYAYGVVAYEMLAGQPPFTGASAQAVLAAHVTTDPDPIAKHRSTVPPALEAMVMRCLQKKPADRWQSMDEVLAQIEMLITPTGTATGLTPTAVREAPPRPRRPWTIAAGVAAIAAVGAFWLTRDTADATASAIDAEPRAWVIVSDFEGPDDGDVVEMARELVSTALNRSSTVEPLPRGELESALQRAGYADTVHVNEDIARELADRNRIGSVVTGRLSAVGSSYTLLLRAVEAETGRELASATGQVDTDDFIDNIGRITSELRASLGDLPEGRTSERPLSSVMTASYEAYKYYREGSRLYMRGSQSYEAARTQLDQAIALDSGFARAYFTKAYSYWSGDWDSLEFYLDKGLEHRDRLSPSEQQYMDLIIAWHYNDLSKALSLAEQRVAAGHRTHHDIGAINVWLRRPEESAKWFRRAIELQMGSPQGNTISGLYANLMASGQFDEARELLPLIDSVVPENANRRAMDLAAVERDWDRILALGQSIAEDPAVSSGRRRDGQGAAISVHTVRGDIGSARDLIARRRADAEQEDAWFAVHGSVWDEALLQSFSKIPGNAITPPIEWHPSVFGQYTRAIWGWSVGDTTVIRTVLDGFDTHPRDLGGVPNFLEGLIDWHGQRWSEIVTSLGPGAARGRDPGRTRISANSVLRRWLVAEAHRQLGNLDSAAVYFELAIDLHGLPTGWIRNRGNVYSWGHYELGGIYAELGQTNRAEEHYAAFLDAFTEPDSSTVFMRENAERELARLAAGR
jgi:serine/threonine-protein kinase